MAIQEEFASTIGSDASAGVVIQGLESSGVGASDLLGFMFFLTLIFCIYREGRRPFLRRGVQAVMRSYRFNLATFLFNDFTLWLLSVPSLYFVADTFSGIGLLSGMEEGALKFLACFLLLDFTMYAWHFAMHHDDGLWVFHRLHHSDPSLNVTTGLRYHAGELVLEVIVRSAFIVALGVDADIMLASQAVISLFVLLHHTNTVLPGERWLAWLFIVPRLHRVHHSVRRDEHDSNYGAVFSIWDRLFGTLKEQEPAAIGLADAGEPDLVAMLRSFWASHPAGVRQTALVPVPTRRH